MARTFSAPRRKTQWAGFGDSAGAAVIPTVFELTPGTPRVISSSMIVGGAAGLFDEEVTITRTIGRLSCAIGSNTAESQGAFAVGLGIFRGESLTVGVTALPSPEDDPDFEWLYYTSGVIINP